MKRVISAFLILVMVLSLVPVLRIEAKAEETDVYALVERQILAYAESIDQPDAVKTAASALAVHGMTMGGKKMTMDANNALTAVLLNSELLQVALAESCTTAIQMMQNFGLEEMPYIYGGVTWGLWEGEEGSNYYTNCYSSDQHENTDLSNYRECALAYGLMPFSQANSYDNSLEWMVSFAEVSLSLCTIEITDNDVTYQVTCAIEDRFDFHSVSNDGFKQLISGLGALLFREFDWESTVSFELTVPYTCIHSSGTYQWTYDAETHSLTAIGMDGFAENTVTRRQTSDHRYYYELDSALHLSHDRPWVVEYDVQNPGEFVLTAFEKFSASESTPCLLNQGSENVFFWNMEYDGFPGCVVRHIRDYRGVAVGNLINFSDSRVYTYRLENEVKPDGKNMVYLTILDRVTGDTILEKTAMDDYYPDGVLDNQSDNGLEGQDLVIKYIGNQMYPLTSDHFELRVWENGKDGVAESYVESTVMEPSCSAQGYTAHTCTKCGYSYKTDIVEKLPHDYVEEVIAPTCTAEGYTSHTCVTCGYSHNTDTVPMLPHDYDNYVSNNDATCAHDGTITGRCTICGATDTVFDEGSALAHTWVDATCTKAKTCQVCGGTEGAPLGHDLKYYNAKAPTCTDLGWEAYEKCRRCHHSTFATIPALGHNYVDDVCQNCGDGDILLGDVNGDGEVDIFDANLIVAYYNGTAELTAAQQKAADVNGDGEIDIFDANLIVAYYNGTISHLN